MWWLILQYYCTSDLHRFQGGLRRYCIVCNYSWTIVIQYYQDVQTIIWDAYSWSIRCRVLTRIDKINHIIPLIPLHWLPIKSIVVLKILLLMVIRGQIQSHQEELIVHPHKEGSQNRGAMIGSLKYIIYGCCFSNFTSYFITNHCFGQGDLHFFHYQFKLNKEAGHIDLIELQFSWKVFLLQLLT